MLPRILVQQPLYTALGILSVYLVLRAITVPSPGSKEGLPSTLVENVNLDCDSIINANLVVLRKLKYWTVDHSSIEQELLASSDICSLIPKYFHFESKPLSSEEEQFPLAYGLVVYKNIVQVLLQLSIFYHPQNQYCITVDEDSPEEFKAAILELSRCHSNIATFVGTQSKWGSFGILENVYNCFHYLTVSGTRWKYYQYLSGSDLPIRTNLEMVRVMKALNGSINTDLDTYEIDRYRMMEGIKPPMPLYKGSMSVAIPREAAEFIVKSRKVKHLLAYLSRTWVPDESFWTTVAGSKNILNVPGSFRAQDILWLRKHLVSIPPLENRVNSVGTSYIGRYQVWSWQKPCGGTVTMWSCAYGVGDIYEVIRRPEVVAHKVYLEQQPAAYMCLLKEIRRRSYAPVPFDTTSYEEMPTVELHNGKSITELTHPEWLLRSSFWRPNES